MLLYWLLFIFVIISRIKVKNQFKYYLYLPGSLPLPSLSVLEFSSLMLQKLCLSITALIILHRNCQLYLSVSHILNRPQQEVSSIFVSSVPLQSLVYNKYSVYICWMNERMVLQYSQIY